MNFSQKPVVSETSEADLIC